MDGRVIGLFIHIVGGVGMCVALGLEWASLWQLRKASVPQQVYILMGIFKGAGRVGIVSMLLNLLVGLYMIWIGWGFAPWITVSLLSLLLVIGLNLAFTRPRMVAVGKTLASEKGPLSATFHSQVNQPLLWVSLQSRLMVVLGVTYIMIDKPQLTISLVIVAISVVLGFASAVPFFRRERAQRELVS